MRLICCVFVLFLALVAMGRSAAAATVTVRNNHSHAYAGEIEFRTTAAAGVFSGKGAGGRISKGVGRVWGTFPANSSVSLVSGAEGERRVPKISAQAGKLYVADQQLRFGLDVTPGRSGDVDGAVQAFDPLALLFKKQSDGSWSAAAEKQGYRCGFRAVPTYGGVDFSCTIRATRASKEPVYVALLRAVGVRGAPGSIRTRWNGREQPELPPPDDNREFWYVRGLDWLSWSDRGRRLAVVNGFTPGFMTKTDSGRYIIGNSFYVWENVRMIGGGLCFVSEISRANPQQESSKFIPVQTYEPLPQDTPITIRWRLALPERTAAGWEDAELASWAGFRKVTENSGGVTVDLGAREVQFGTSYFPYSTLTENFDYYRTPGLDREGWWPFSRQMWEQWRKFVPMMQTDLRIIKSMGFQWVRLHHLELLGDMERAEALAFLDFYTTECRKLGLYVLADTAGSPEWIGQIMSRYGERIRRLELENEVLIPGIKPDDPARWSAQYTAAKTASPDAQVFLTGTANQPVFDQLLMLGVPFDRVGIHMYKHGPGWEESFRSLAMGVGAHARDLDREVTMGEFNWKELTRLAPEERAKRFARIYGYMLEPRAISEFFQFHFQETLSVNPRLTRQGIRHYETISLDRSPKPEALEMMKLIRKYSSPTYGQNKVVVSVRPSTLASGKALASFTVTNKTRSALDVTLGAEAFGGITARVQGKSTYLLKPGASVSGKAAVEIGQEGLPGTYHLFIRASFGSDASYGWGVVSNPGAPDVSDDAVLPDLVADDTTAWDSIDWERQIAVAFGPKAPVLEIEMAYLLASTLQSATGRKVRLSSTDDLLPEASERGLLLLVGTSESNPMINSASPDDGKGRVVRSDRGSAQVVELTGRTPESVQAVVTDIVLRYWKHAKDSSTGITGVEKGAALGNKALPGDVNLP